MAHPDKTDLDALEWPREIWMAEREDHDQGVVSAVLSEQATVARFAGDVERDRDFHRYVDGDIYDSADRYHETMTANLRGQNMALIDAVARLSEARDELDALLNEGIATDADTYQQAYAAGLEAAAKVAGDFMEQFAKATYESEDGRLQNAAKCYAAGDIFTAIRAIKEPQP